MWDLNTLEQKNAEAEVEIRRKKKQYALEVLRELHEASLPFGIPENVRTEPMVIEYTIKHVEKYYE